MRLLLLSLLVFGLNQVQAAPLTIEITEGAEGAQPIAIVPFGGQEGVDPNHDIAAVIRSDLRRSGRFKPMPEEDMLASPTSSEGVDFRDWKALNMDYLVVGQMVTSVFGRHRIQFQLFDVFTTELMGSHEISAAKGNLRAAAHRIADIIYERITGERGAFSTRVAYITSIGKKVALRVADADGFNPKTIVDSKDPLMSPAWSPDGEKLAYVSFEKGQPAIYIQQVFSGKRKRITSYPGINGAPAWSPDGKKLALTLSMDGSPDIYVLDLETKALTRLTNHYSIDTEPAWSPDGRTIVFTSDRGGKPQIYRVSSSGGGVQRVSYEGNYNARASYSPDGKRLTLVTRHNSGFQIGILNLERGWLQVLSEGRLDESPSFAPNGSMVIYATKAAGKGELAAISVDGNVRQRLALQSGDVREPAWSPFNQSNHEN